MMILDNIINGMRVSKIVGELNINIEGLTLDSRKVQKNFLFIAIEGNNTDGHQFINQAIENGAIAIVHTKDVDYLPNITYIKSKENSQAVAALLAHNFYNKPSQKIKIIGVTGTNGKTTIATTLYNLFNLLGVKSGLISTIANFVGDEKIETKLTTPDPIELHCLFNKMYQKGCIFCFMEVSSHSAHQQRIAYIDFDAAIFTNLTHDHLDYHYNFKNYIDAKKIFFDNLKKDAIVLTNIDDRNGNYVVQNTYKHYTYALKTIADFNARVIERHFDCTLAEIDGIEVWLQFVGTFNVYNILAVYGITKQMLGLPKQDILNAISTLKPVQGRFDVLKIANIYAIVDYAHTPDALQKTLCELKDIKTENQKIITVFGAGGNRDATKRPEMAKVCSTLSDIVIITSDNPRNENPISIIDDIEKGIAPNTKYFKIVDRKEAIKMSVELAHQSDIIFIAGKGHENYQEINGKRHHFDDKQVVELFLKSKFNN